MIRALEVDVTVVLAEVTHGYRGSPEALAQRFYVLAAEHYLGRPPRIALLSAAVQSEFRATADVEHDPALGTLIYFNS